MAKKQQYYKTLDNSHGRLEKREYYVCNDIEWLSQKNDWAGLEGIGLCRSERTLDEKKTVEYSYAIYSLKDCTAEQFAKYKRGHWSIENSLHWGLAQDFQKIRFVPATFKTICFNAPFVGRFLF